MMEQERQLGRLLNMTLCVHLGALHLLGLQQSRRRYGCIQLAGREWDRPVC